MNFRLCEDVAYREYGDFRVYYKTCDVSKKMYSIDGVGNIVLDFISEHQFCSHHDIFNFIKNKYPGIPFDQIKNDVTEFLEAMIIISILEGKAL
jgi:hypothetical protein